MKLKRLNQTFTPDFTSTLKAALLCTALVGDAARNSAVKRGHSF